jgi:hypothetical protein
VAVFFFFFLINKRKGWKIMIFFNLDSYSENKRKKRVNTSITTMRREATRLATICVRRLGLTLVADQET